MTRFTIEIYYADTKEFYDIIEVRNEYTAAEIYASYLSDPRYVIYMHKYVDGEKIY